MTPSAPSSWQPYLDLLLKQAEALRKAVVLLPPSYLLLLLYSKEFLSSKEAVLRLYNYAFTYRFCLVTASSSIKTLRLRLSYKYYRSST